MLPERPAQPGRTVHLPCAFARQTNCALAMRRVLRWSCPLARHFKRWIAHIAFSPAAVEGGPGVGVILCQFPAAKNKPSECGTIANLTKLERFPWATKSLLKPTARALPLPPLPRA